MYRSYSYNDMPQPVIHKQAEEECRHEGKKEIKKAEERTVCKNSQNSSEGLFDLIKSDDVILLVVIFILLMDNCDDKLLLAALAFIFLSDMF